MLGLALILMFSHKLRLLFDLGWGRLTYVENKSVVLSMKAIQDLFIFITAGVKLSCCFVYTFTKAQMLILKLCLKQCSLIMPTQLTKDCNL